MGPAEARVIHIPGHTAGQVALFGHGKPIHSRASDHFGEKWSD